MVSRGGTDAGRLRWGAIFALLLCALSAAPVFASEDPPPESAQHFSEEPPKGPGPEDILAALREAEKQDGEREAALAGPAAIQEREDSRTAYTDLTPAEAEQLLSTQFSEQLEGLETDPARFLSDAKLDRSQGDTGATVTSEGDTQLLEAGIPVRAEDEGGDLHKVDLSLEADADSYEPENPLVSLDIAKSAEAGLEFGEDGISIAQAGIEPSSAYRLGDIDLFYPEVATDTDLVVSPVAEGVELFNQLRSAESPRTLHFALDLPEGSELRLDGIGGAEVSRAGEMLAHIPPPSAIDAQGSDVPVGMEIEGSSVSLQVSPAEGEAAFPILVDPILENWGYETWENGYHFEALEPATTPWIWNEGPPNWAYHSTSFMRTKWGPSGRGLYISSPSGSLPSGFAQWQYATPNVGSYLVNASIGNFHRYNYNCPKSSYPLPYDFDGMWHGSNWNRLEFNKANDAGWTTIESWGDVFIFGLGQGNPISIPCWRDIAAGGAAIWLDDYQYPYIDSVAGVPSGWINDVTPFTITVNSSDAGLGVQFVSIVPEGAPVIQKRLNNCTGLSASRCPNSASTPFVLNAGYFDQGIQNSTVSVMDPTGKDWRGYSFQTMVDRAPPEVTLNGQLAQATNEVGNKEVAAGTGDQLSLPVYNLQIEAKDGVKGGTSAQKRSGVKSIEVFLDSKQTAEQTWTQPCSESSCEMKKTYTLKLAELSSGTHTLRVITSDQVSQKLERKIEFEYMPATGLSDDFVMQRFPLPDGQGNEAEEEKPDRPELAVNVMNGNLVYRQQDVEVDGYGANLEVERYYNSMLPSTENTEWGDGWTLEQAPKLTPEAGETPKTGTLKDASGKIEGPISLPTESGQKKFDPKLKATITKESDGGYGLKDESGETDGVLAFSPEGKVKELRSEGYAKVDYTYASGKLDEIAVKDPASASGAASAEGTPQTPSYASSFSGAGETALKAPGDVAIDAEGNLWVADKTNNRIERFDPKGNFLSKFGSYGTASGQLNRPASLAIGANGNIWVADANNNRIQEFSPTGQVLKTIGTFGPGEKQFSGPEGIAVDYRGNVWVADTGNGRLQEYTENGSFVKFAGSKSAGSGQLGEPTGIDVGPGGDMWVADWQNNRIKVFNQAGEFVRQFGEYGTGSGQFKNPDAIDVDNSGNVWVSDTANGRVQLFNQAGQYVAKFGVAGPGSGQFGFIRPTGIATVGMGTIWIADPNNNRVQKWTYPVKEANDPSVDVVTSSGLVSEVTGPEAGKDTYSYNGDDLTAQKGPAGETKYTYDSAGRMTKVQLPNGNYATITYNTTYGRVSSVTTVIGGISKKTSFTYSDEPRRTEVIPPGAPVVTYDIGADGSVLRWWNAVKPPEFHDLAGSLYAGRETATPISPGDQNLVVEGYSEEGIDSVQIVASGNQLVHETTCKQDTDKLGTECVNVPSEWVTNTGNFPPGNLQLEAVVTSREGKSESRRFWVNIPPPPPPLAEGTPIPPTFEATLHFREDFGLDVWKSPVNELARNDLIFNLIGAWWSGETLARASMERWGAPLQSVDVAELEFRQEYQDQAAQGIPLWAQTNAASNYAGYYIDERSGGLIRVGFAGGQASQQLEALRQTPGLLAPARIAAFTEPPAHPLQELEGIESAIRNSPSMNISRVGIDIKNNRVSVGAGNVNQVTNELAALLGSGAPFAVYYEPEALQPRSGRERNSGYIAAGDWLSSPYFGSIGCTAGYGAWENSPAKPNGEVVHKLFLLDVAHCFIEGEKAERRDTKTHVRSDVGKTVRDGYDYLGSGHSVNGWSTDGSAIRVENPQFAPRDIWVSPSSAIEVKEVAPVPQPGTWVCFSGQASDKVICGAITVSEKVVFHFPGGNIGPQKLWLTCFKERSIGGDSGGPVWIKGTHKAIGLLSAGDSDESCLTPLLPVDGHPQAPGILSAPGLGSLHLLTRP